jgi:hypothetical protein
MSRAEGRHHAVGSAPWKALRGGTLPLGLCPRVHDAIHRGQTVQLRNGRWLNAHGWTEAPLTLDY